MDPGSSQIDQFTEPGVSQIAYNYVINSTAKKDKVLSINKSVDLNESNVSLSAAYLANSDHIHFQMMLTRHRLHLTNAERQPVQQ